MRESDFNPRFKIDPNYEWFYDMDDNVHHNKLVNVDVGMLDQLWAKDHSLYIGPNGDGQIRTRYQDFGNFLTTKPSVIYTPFVTVSNDGKVVFSNGRHRFAWFRDHGYKMLPIAMDNDSIKNAKKLGLL